LGDKQNWNIMP